MPDAPANAWTGHHLLRWLQAHPQWLDRPVHLLMMTSGEEDAYLTTAEEDQFDPGDPNVISLIADGPGAAVTLPCPVVDREQLVELLATSALRRYESQYEASHLTWRDFATEATEDVDAMIAAGWVLTEPLPEWPCPACGATTRARMADRQHKEATDATP